MARTKASVGAKVASGKSSKARCSAAPTPSTGSGSSGSSERSSRSYSGGNTACPRDTPKWQRPITNFFMGKAPSHDTVSDGEETGDSSATSSKSKQKRNVIHSDDESQSPEHRETPKNTVLDDTIELEPLTGEDSHKIEEYYPKGGEKGKGKGKRTNDKENLDDNVAKRKSVKRDLEDVVLEEESHQVSKKVKVN